MRAALFAVGLALLVAVELGAPTRDPFGNGTATAAAPATNPCERATEEQKTTLTRPADLLLLEMPDRAIWQRPDDIMDKLNIADSAWVADVGAGSGWFTIRLSQRVDPQKRGRGKVFAQDVQQEMLTAIDRRVRREGFRNVVTIRGDDESTRLPRHVLDAILVVDVYSEIAAEKRIAFLRDLADSLKPTGRIGIVNYKPGAGGPGPECRFPRSVVERDARAADLQLFPTVDLLYQYVVVLGKEPSKARAVS
jgi:SAM-dependent methyltransferase